MTILTEPEIVTPSNAGQRIDKWLSDRYPDYSRTYFQQLIADGFVLLNGKPVKKRIAPEVGDEIEVCFQLTPECTLEPENIPLDILFEDEHLIAVNKSAGMVVHPAPGHPNGTFVNALLFHCQDLAPNFEDPLRPGIVHRLDKDTSGVLLAAKTALAHHKLVQMFSSRLMEKMYLAICMGRPQDQTICAPIGRNPSHRQSMAVLDIGKEATSQIQVLAFNETISLVLIRPQTGRTHQIRVHLEYIGHPVLGDTVYGNENGKADRQMLHAYRLNFSHPITHVPISLTAPIPSDMKQWINQIAEEPSLACIP